MSITNYNGSALNNASNVMGVAGVVGSLFSPNNTNIKSAKQLIAEEKEREQERLNNYTKMLEGSQEVLEKTQKEAMEYYKKHPEELQKYSENKNLKKRSIGDKNINKKRFLANYNQTNLINKAKKKFENWMQQINGTNKLKNEGWQLGSFNLIEEGISKAYYGTLKNGKPHGVGAVYFIDNKTGKTLFHTELQGYYNGELLSSAEITESGLARLLDLAKRPDKPVEIDDRIDVFIKTYFKTLVMLGKQLLWDYNTAHKKDNTTLIHFSHYNKDRVLFNISGHEFKHDPIMSCKKFYKKKYDKKYNGGICIDINNFNLTETQNKVKQLIDEGANKNIQNFKIYLGSHGRVDGELGLMFPMDIFKKILFEYLPVNLKNKTFILDMDACFSAKFNDLFNFDVMKIIKDASLRLPDWNFIIKSHNNNRTSHYTFDFIKTNSQNHMTSKYQLVSNGTLTDIPYYESCEMIGDDCLNKKSLNPIRERLQKGTVASFLCLLFTMLCVRSQIKQQTIYVNDGSIKNNQRRSKSFDNAFKNSKLTKQTLSNSNTLDNQNLNRSFSYKKNNTNSNNVIVNRNISNNGYNMDNINLDKSNVKINNNTEGLINNETIQSEISIDNN